MAEVLDGLDAEIVSVDKANAAVVDPKTFQLTNAVPGQRLEFFHIANARAAISSPQTPINIAFDLDTDPHFENPIQLYPQDQLQAQAWSKMPFKTILNTIIADNPNHNIPLAIGYIYLLREAYVKMVAGEARLLVAVGQKPTTESALAEIPPDHQEVLAALANRQPWV